MISLCRSKQILVVLVLLLSFMGCKRDREPVMYRESRLLMDTICTITVVSRSELKAKEAIDAGFSEIERLEGLLDRFSSESEIVAINRAAGVKPVKVSRETLDIIEKAIRIAELTDGAFDPTIGAVTALWDFKSGSIPDRKVLRQRLSLVDYRRVRIDRESSEVFLEKKGMGLDLGGIAKGYTADRVIEVLRAQGIKAALVAIAGDIRGFGLKPDMLPWRIGVQNPRPGDRDIITTLYLRDRAISTSGDYQRFFIKNGRRYHHILDPRTGYPAGGAISVSVVAPEGFMADGLSTGVFILGPDRGIRLLEELGLSGIIVDSHRRILITDDLKGKIDIGEDL